MDDTFEVFIKDFIIVVEVAEFVEVFDFVMGD